MSLLSALIVLIAWYALALIVSHVRGVHFPTPWTTAIALAKLLAGQTLADHSIYEHIAHSLARWSVAFCFAALAGIAYGLVASWCRTVEQLTVPIVHILQLIPGLAWIPVALLRDRPEDVARFLRALHRAEETIQSAPRETAATLARITGLTPEVARNAMAKHRYTLSLDTTIIESLRQTATFLQTQGTIPSVPDLSHALDNRPLAALAPPPGR